MLYFKKKEYDKARKDYSEAIRLNRKFADAHFNRGNVYGTKKEYDKAIKDYNEAIHLDPQLAIAYANLAWVLSTCPKDDVRDGRKAIEHATKACKLSEWKNGYHLASLAAAHAQNGNFKEAVKWQKKAIELGFVDEKGMEKGRQRLKLYEEGKPCRDE